MLSAETKQRDMEGQATACMVLPGRPLWQKKRQETKTYTVKSLFNWCQQLQQGKQRQIKTVGSWDKYYPRDISMRSTPSPRVIQDKVWLHVKSSLKRINTDG